MFAVIWLYTLLLTVVLAVLAAARHYVYVCYSVLCITALQTRILHHYSFPSL